MTGEWRAKGDPTSSSHLKLRVKFVCVLVAQLCPNIWDSMDCRPPGFSVHESLQARILEWRAIPISRGSS